MPLSTNERETLLRRFRSIESDLDALDRYSTIASADRATRCRLALSVLLPIAAVGAGAYPGASRIQGAACVRTRQWQQALAYFEAAERLHPPRAWDWAFRALAHAGNGQNDLAFECLNKARHWLVTADAQPFPDVDMTIPSWGNWAWHERGDVLRLVAEVESLIERAQSSKVDY